MLGLRNSAPYLHDGSARALSEVIQLSSQALDHGKTSHLTTQQANDLLIFLKNIQIPSQASITPKPFAVDSSFQKIPKNRFTNLVLTKNIQKNASGSRLKIELSYSSNLETDLYLAFLNRETNDFIMIGPNGDLNLVNTIAKYRAHRTAKALNTSTVVDLPFDPDEVVGLSLDFYAILTNKDASVIDSNNWLSSKNININF
mgnify:CR=1 FL=1